MNDHLESCGHQNYVDLDFEAGDQLSWCSDCGAIQRMSMFEDEVGGDPAPDRWKDPKVPHLSARGESQIADEMKGILELPRVRRLHPKERAEIALGAYLQSYIPEYEEEDRFDSRLTVDDLMPDSMSGLLADLFIWAQYEAGGPASLIQGGVNEYLQRKRIDSWGILTATYEDFRDVLR